MPGASGSIPTIPMLASGRHIRSTAAPCGLVLVLFLLRKLAAGPRSGNTWAGSLFLAKL